MRRKILAAIAIVLLAGAVAFYWYTRPLPILTVTTWPGDYGRAQAAALMRPYASAKRVDVHIAQWDGDLQDVRNAIGSHIYKGDVIDFELPGAIAACRQGLLERIDAATLPPGADDTPATKDFLPGAIGPCWIGSVIYSQVIIFDPRRFSGPAPATLADFFDLNRFPGRRVLRRASPKLNLEMALLADGVTPRDIYRTLETPAGLDRAIAKLDSIRNAIIWAGSAAEAVDLVRSGQAAFATTLNQAVFDAGLHGFHPGVIWDCQLYEFDVFGVPKGDPKKDMAMDFIRFATGSAPLAGVADWVPLGPARRSSMLLVGSNPDLKIPMRDNLPTAHFDTAFAVDDGWWLTHEAGIMSRWRAWQAH
ncbi:MAG TPA: extracellular solute-binding protein [Rhizomicrobium sp.]|nr:extracellular solute-binding protein [Rhizomicrobium sp.]